MFGRDDLAFLLAWLGISLIPLTTIFLVSKRFAWSPKDRHFLTAWWLWLAWILSTYAGLLGTIVSLDRFSLASSLPAIPSAFFIAFLFGTAAIYIVIGLLRAKSVELIGLNAVTSSIQPSLAVLVGDAIIISLSAWGSAFVGIVVAGLLISSYEWFFPLQEPFGIY